MAKVFLLFRKDNRYQDILLQGISILNTSSFGHLNINQYIPCFEHLPFSKPANIKYNGTILFV